MGFFKKELDDKNQQFAARVRIVGREAFLVVVLVMVVGFLVFRFPDVRKAVVNIETYIMGIFYGIIFAFLLDPICRFFQQRFDKAFQNVKKGKKLSKALAIVVSLLIGIGAIAIMLGMIIPNLVDSMTKLVSSLPDYASSVQTWINDRARDHTELAGYLTTFINNASGTLSTWIQTKLADASTAVVSWLTNSIIDVVKFLVNVLVGIIISVYLLRDKEKAIGQMKKFTYAAFSKKQADLIMETAHEGNRIFGGFIHGKILDSLIVGVICLLFTVITNMPYALLISVIVCVTNVIPVFGPFLGAIPSAFLILMVSPVKCLEFIIFILILQQVDGNIIGPRILGNKVGLNEFWVTFSLLLFGGIFGFFGMLIGVPLFAVCYYIIVRILNTSLAKKELSQNSGDYQNVHSYKDIPRRREEAQLPAGDVKKEETQPPAGDPKTEILLSQEEPKKEEEGVSAQES